MTHEQSVRNLEVVKSLTHLYQGDYVYIKFNNDFEFEIVRLAKFDQEFHFLMLDRLHDHNLAYGHLWQPPLLSEPHLRYIDSNFNFFMNLTNQQYTITYPGAPVDTEEAREEFLQLISQFK